DDMPTTDFWLRYWTAAYRYALDNRTPNVVFVDFDRLLTERAAYLAEIGRTLGLRNPGTLVEQAGNLRTPTTPGGGPYACSADTLRAAQAVHAELRAATGAAAFG